MPYIIGGVIFLFGSALGSFIAVIADRYNTGLSFFKGRSICFSCNHELQSKDLVPVFSFLFLKGRCRYCGSKIPKGTFLVEILMGALSVLAAFKSGFLGFNFSLLLTTYYLLLITILGIILLISIYDFKHFIIPDAFLIAFFVFSLFYLLVPTFFNFSLLLTTYYLLLFTNLISGLILALPFLLIFLISKGTWFGFGDVKYIAVLGFFLGLAEGLSAVVLAFWIGAGSAVLVLVLKKIGLFWDLPLFKNKLTIKSEIPFGPFLSLGVIISFYLSLDLFKIHELFF